VHPRSTILITGIAGFIGSHIAGLLLEEGHAVAGLDDLSSGRLKNVPEGAEFFKTDLCDASGVREAFEKTRPPFVIHHAAQVSVSRSVKDPVSDARVNVLGTLNILRLCAEYSVKGIIFASSGGALYGDVNSPANEDFPLSPRSPYGLSKWAGEEYVRYFQEEYGIHYVILRYGNVYGPRQDPQGEAGVVAIFAHQLISGEIPTINGDGEYVRDYVYVEDVAKANVAALKKYQANAILNIGTGKGTSVNNLFDTMAGLVGAGVSPRFGPPRPGDLRSSILDPSRAKEVLGWEPQVPLAEGLEKTIKWFRKKEPVGGSHS
jgi:UDP-glucose 4-epimerase